MSNTPELTDEQLRWIADSKDTATCRQRIFAALQSAADTPAPQQNVAGATEAELMRQKAISNARERNAALRAIQAALDDFELIVDRINAGQINRACATAMQGAKEAKLALAATATEDALSPFKAKEE